MPPPQTPPVVVFDLDGTLVDTAPDLAATMNEVLRRRGRAAVAVQEVRNRIGHGARSLMARAMADTGEAAGDVELDRLAAEFIEVYAERIADESRPFPGVVAAMDRLAAAGCRFAVCTNKRVSLSERLLCELGLRERFAAVIGGDSLHVAKPDPLPLLESVARAGGVRQAAVMVGDSITDISAARAAGMPVIGVSFGYTDRPMAGLAPDRLIDHFDALPEAVAALVPGLRRSSSM